MLKQKRQQRCWRYGIESGILPKRYYTVEDTFCQEESLKNGDLGGGMALESQNTHPYKTRVGYPPDRNMRCGGEPKSKETYDRVRKVGAER
jgi:hypothetical protein